MRRQLVAQVAHASISIPLTRGGFLTQAHKLAHQQFNLLLLAGHDLVELVDKVFEEGELDLKIGQAVGVGQTRVLMG